MAISNIHKIREGRLQLAGLFDTVLEFEAKFNAPNINSNGFYEEDMAAPGAKLGDFVLINAEADLQHLSLEAFVETINNVSIHLINNTAGAIDLPEVDIHVILLRPIHLHNGS